MPYINTIEINGQIYYLSNLTDGDNIVQLPSLNGSDDYFILRSEVIDSTSNSSTSKPLSANQGRVLNSRISTLTTNLNTETSRAKDAESTLTTNLDAEIERAKAAEKKLTEDFTSEANRTSESESTLTTNLNSEISRAKQAESDLNTALSNESTRAQSAESTLTTNLDSEVTRATEAENTLTTNLNNEITRAKEAEQTLTNDLSAEVTRATNKETEINTTISNLDSYVKEQDTALDGKITQLRTDMETADANTLSSAKSYTDTNRTEIDEAIADLQSQLDAQSESSSGDVSSLRTYIDTQDTATLNAAKTYTDDNAYEHPTYTEYSSGLYKIVVDSTGHVYSATAATKEDIVDLGIPAQDTVYTLPQATDTEIGGVKISADYSTGADDVAASTSALKAVYDALEARIKALEDESSGSEEAIT